MPLYFARDVPPTPDHMAPPSPRVHDPLGLFPDEATIPCIGRTGRAAPAGPDSVCRFRTFSFTVLHQAALTLDITPIVDGVPLETHTARFGGDGVTRCAERVALPLAAPRIVDGIELARVAPSGTWIDAEVVLAPPEAVVFLHEDAIEVQYDLITLGPVSKGLVPPAHEDDGCQTTD